MRKKLAILLCLVFLFTVLAPQTALAYQSPTAEQKKEVQDKIDEGNKIGDDLIKKVDEMNEAGDDAAKEKARQEALELLAKLEKARQEAVVLADKYYQPDGKNAKGEPTYDPSVSGEGATSPDGTVKIGEDAFSDPGWLASTKLHEFNHADRVASGTWPTNTKAKNMAECEAYDQEIKNAATSGLSKEQIEELKKRRKGYYDGLTAENQKKVDGSEYVASIVPLKDAIATGLVVARFLGQGRAAGHIFDLIVTRQTPQPFTLEIPLGTPLIPGDPTVQTMMVGKDVCVKLEQPVTTVSVPGYCLEPQFCPPPAAADYGNPEGPPAPTEEPGWEVVNPLEDPPRYYTPMNIIKAGNQLSQANQFHTDMPQPKYLETVVQQAIWHEMDPEKYNKEKLQQDLTEQVKESGGKQTPEQIQQLTDHLWEDISLTLKESQKHRTQKSQ